MRSATAFLPSSIMTLTNFETSTLPYRGSGRISRLGTSRRRGIGISSLIHLAGSAHHAHRRRDRSTRSTRRWTRERPLTGPGAASNTRADRHPEKQEREPREPARALATKTASGLLRTLRAVLRPGLLAILDPLEVERTAHDVIAHTREVFHTTATNQHHRVLLQVVAFAADVRDDLETVGETHLGDLPKRRVRLLGRGRVDAGADAATLRAILQGRALAL